MRALLFLPTILVACGGNAQGHEAPKLPPLNLASKMPVLKELASPATKPATKERLAELSDLMETAFSQDASARLQTMAKRSLLEAKDAFWILEQGLEHADANMRSIAAHELGGLGHQASIIPLLKRLKYEQDPKVLVWVTTSLARLGNHGGLPNLVSLMERGDTAQQAGLKSIELLKSLGVETGERPNYGQLKAWLREQHRKWCEKGIVEGVENSKPDPLTTARLAEHLTNLQGFALRPVDDARFVLVRAGVLSLELLAKAVHASEPYLRNHALEIARDLGRPARPLGPEILPLLADPLSRTVAAQALGSIGAPECLPHLLGMLESPEPEVRAAAAESLGPLGDKQAIAPLKAILRDQKETMDVRVRAAYSLALFELERPAFEFLKARKAKGDYHEPTIDEMMSRVEQERESRR